MNIMESDGQTFILTISALIFLYFLYLLFKQKEELKRESMNKVNLENRNFNQEQEGNRLRIRNQVLEDRDNNLRNEIDRLKAENFELKSQIQRQTKSPTLNRNPLETRLNEAIENLTTENSRLGRDIQILKNRNTTQERENNLLMTRNRELENLIQELRESRVELCRHQGNFCNKCHKDEHFCFCNGSAMHNRLNQWSDANGLLKRKVDDLNHCLQHFKIHIEQLKTLVRENNQLRDTLLNLEAQLNELNNTFANLNQMPPIITNASHAHH